MIDLFSPLELKARTLLAKATEGDCSAARRMVCGVFKAMWCSALDEGRIASIARAIYLDERDLRAALHELCNEGILRTRKAHGERLYEIAI